MSDPEVVSVGEAFVDLVSMKPTDDLSTARSFEKMAGGAPANVAVGLAQLGIRTAFVGKVGKDPFGRFVIRELRERGVDTRGIIEDPRFNTRLAFVAVTNKGDRDFQFWERDPADQHLNRSEINFNSVCRAAIINIGPFMLLNPKSRATAIALAHHAQQKGTAICFDPNVRISLWKNHTVAIRAYRAMIRCATILRLNDEEARLITGTADIEVASHKLLAMGPRLVVITRDKEGCQFAAAHASGAVRGFVVNAVDTVGCGDGFLAGLLAGIIQTGKAVNELSNDNLMAICTTANAVGALVATKRGAIAAMPTMNEVKKFLKH
jgi:fructokinase